MVMNRICFQIHRYGTTPHKMAVALCNFYMFAIFLLSFNIIMAYFTKLNFLLTKPRQLISILF